MFVSAVGLFNRPKIPAVHGREDFSGEQFHSSRWPADYDPADRRIAVVGAGASAVQIVPAIAPEAECLAVFQRTPQYVGPMAGRTGGLDDGAWLSRRIAKTVLVHPDCHSCFQTASGKATTQWPGFMSEYRFRTRRVRRSDYVWA